MLQLDDFYLFSNNKTLFLCNNFKLNPFEKAVIIGNNSSGKSLLCKAIMGNYKNYKGNIITKKTALISKESNFISNYSVKKWLHFGLTKAQKENLPKLLEISKIYKNLDEKISQISYTKQKICEIIKAVATLPSLILIDSILNSFDENNQMLAMRLINIACKQGCSLLAFSVNSLPGFWNIYTLKNQRLVKQ